MEPGETPTEKYQIIEKISHGSMGAAFKARVFPDGSMRVLKLLASHLAEDEAVVEAFRQAVQAAKAIRHKHVASIESFERAKDGRPFIVMEYFPGMALRESMLRQGPMNPSYIREVATQVCSALDAGQRVGILHRNLKPENILIVEESDSTLLVKVMEFGLAAAREAAALHDKPIADAEMTDFGPIVGLCEYISPEQAAGNRSGTLDGRTDIYSVGAIMFEALTGNLPHYVEDLAGSLSQTPNASKNERLFEIILRALQHNPRNRYSSAAEMAADLHEIAALPVPASVQLHSASGENAQIGAGPPESLPFEPRARSGQKPIASMPGVRPPQYPKVGEVPLPPAHPRSPRKNRPAPLSDNYLDDLRRSLAHGNVKPPHGRGRNAGTRWGFIICLALGVGLGGIWLASRWFPAPGPQQVMVPKGPEDIALPLGVQEPESPSIGNAESAGTSTAPFDAAPPAGQAEDASGLQEPPPQPVATSSTRSSIGQDSPKSQTPMKSASTKTAATNAATRSSQPAEAVADQAAARSAAVKQKMAAGWAFMGQKNYGAAMENFSEALKIDPSNSEAQAAMRMVRYALQHPDVELFSASEGSGRSMDKQ